MNISLGKYHKRWFLCRALRGCRSDVNKLAEGLWQQPPPRLQHGSATILAKVATTPELGGGHQAGRRSLLVNTTQK